MRLAFNATALLSPFTGIGQYTRQLALGLAQAPEVDPEFFYGAAWGRSVRDAPLPGAARVLPWVRQHVPFSYELRRFVQSRRFAGYARAQRFDLYHEPNIVPLPFDGPLVLTVHDLSWIRHPEAHPPERVRAMGRHFEPGLRRAAMVLTDAAFVREEVIAEFGLAPERVRAIPLGVDGGFRPRDSDETEPTLRRWGLRHGAYFLGVGTLEPRKNLRTAIAAYRSLPEALRATAPLVVVGMKGWDHDRENRELDALARAGQLVAPGYLPRDELAIVTAGALALVYPSLYEGFGLPPLEAMASGVPVIASNASTLPEVVGPGGLLVDALDADGLARAMRSLAEDAGLRARLAALGLAHSAGFSWRRCVGETVAAYRDVLERA